MTSDRNIEVDRSEFYELRGKVNEIYEYLFGSRDQRSEQQTRKPLYYMMPDIEKTISSIADDLSTIRRGQTGSYVTAIMALTFSLIALGVSLFALYKIISPV